MTKHDKPCQNFCTELGGPPDAPCILCGHSRGAHYRIEFRKDRLGEGMFEVGEVTPEPYPQIETIFTHPAVQAGKKPLEDQLRMDRIIFGNAFVYEEDDGTKRRLDPTLVAMSSDTGKTKITVLPEEAAEDVLEPYHTTPFRLPVDTSKVADKTYSIGIDWGFDPKEQPQMAHLRNYVWDALRTENIPSLNITAHRSDGSMPTGRSASYPAITGKRNVRLVHVGLGMASELSEYIEAYRKADTVNVLEELGDIMWYWAIAVADLGLDPWKIARQGQMIAPATDHIDRGAELVFMDLVEAVGNFADIAKKLAVYGRPFRLVDAGALLSQIYRAVDDLHKLRDCGTLEETLTKNIEKLRHRYPEKYTDEKANERDTEGERRVLEGRALAESIPCNDPEHCTVPSHAPLHRPQESE